MKPNISISSSDENMLKGVAKLCGDKSFSKSISERDRQVFFDAVFSDKKPNQSLVEAAERYKAVFKSLVQQRGV